MVAVCQFDSFAEVRFIPIGEVFVSIRQRLASLRGQGFAGICAGGAAAGLAAAHASGGGYLVASSLGGVIALLGSLAGLGAGVATRSAFALLRRRSDRSAPFSVEAALVLAAYLGFLGLVAALVTGNATAGRYFVAIGSMCGACGAVWLGDVGDVLADMLAMHAMGEDEREQYRAQTRRKAQEMYKLPDDFD